MDKVSEKSASELAGLRFACSCGREHAVDIERIVIGKNIECELLDVVKGHSQGTILVVTDNNTLALKGRAVADSLNQAGLKTQVLTFQTVHPLVPDETAVGRILLETGSDISLIVAVGSGTLNDLSRYVSFRLCVPYVIVATAPSMDGYASTVSPLIIAGFKKTYEAHYPIAILGDLDSMVKAPDTMICAGFGDIMGKFTALADWALSARRNGEYYCEETVSLVKKAVDTCVANAEGIAARQADAIRSLIDALILSGVAMGLVGNSRPASGAEHHLAHYWEMDALKKGVEHPLHGNMVGVGTLVIARLYHLVHATDRLDMALPDGNHIHSLLKTIGAPVSPLELGVPRDVFYESILHAKEIRPRYTVMHLAEKLGVLELAAQQMTELYYS